MAQINIAGTLHNTEEIQGDALNSHVVAHTDEILDRTQTKKQSEVNADVQSELNAHDEAINAPSTGLEARVDTLEEQVAFSGDFQTANTPADVVSGSGKITTANAVAAIAEQLKAEVGYYPCTTVAGTAAKVIPASAAPNYVLTVGGSVKVKMTNKNTAANPTLKIGNAEAKPLYYGASRASSSNTWEAGEVIEVYYDGENLMANNVEGGGGDGVFDISAYNASGEPLAPAVYDNLTAALGSSGANVPASKRKGGMSVKFILQLFTVAKTTSQTQPTGTELTTDPGLAAGTAYKASDLSAFATLPTTDDVVYYASDGETTPTYTIYTISKNAVNVCEYVQYRYMSTDATTNATFVNVANWQGVDETPTVGSHNLVESGGVASEIVWDVTARNGNVVFASLSALLSDANLATLIPTDIRRGGMSIKFVQSSDNNYVQCRYMQSDASTVATFTNVANWQGVDEELTQYSNNLITNNAVFDGLDTRCIILVGEGAWQGIGKTDWAVGDRFFQYYTPESMLGGFIRTVKAVSNNGATVSAIYTPPVIAPQDTLYVVNGKFYTYKGGESLVRLADIQDILTLIGSLSSLDTTSQTSIVAAVNEVLSYVGNISSLTTSAKTSVVAAINEVIGTTIGALSGLKTTDKTSVVLAINELANKFIETISTPQSVRENKYWNTKQNGAVIAVGDTWTGRSTNLSGSYSSEAIPVQEGEVYKYYGIGSNSTASKSYVITDSSDKVLVISSLANNSNYRTTPFDIVIPKNGAKLYVNFTASYDSTTDKLVKYTEQEIDLVQMQEDIDDLKLDVEELKKLPLYGKTIVCFGDSMTEFSLSTKKRYSDYLADISGANVINIGIGGTRLAQRAIPSLTPSSRLQAIAALDICNLVKASVEQDFSLQDAAMAYLASIEDPIAGKVDIINRLKSIDWSVVDVVTVCGGANDWMSDVNLGEEDSANLGEALGGLNYILQSLTYTYPKIRVFYFAQIMLGNDANLRSGAANTFNKNHAYIIGDDVFYAGKLWRFTADHQGDWSDNDARRITQAELQAMGSDVVTNANSLTFKQYTRALIGCSTNNHIPTCDMYMTMWNMNQLPSVMHADFHHPLNGMEQIAEKFYGFILANRNFDM